MAEEAKNSAAAHAAEIEALKRQIEEMNKRLEELSAATSADVAAEDDASASAASAEVAEPATQTQDNAEEEGGVEAEDVVGEKGACSSDPIEGAEEAIEVEAVPAPVPNVPAAAPEAPRAFPNTPPIEKVVDDDGKPVDPAYVAAAVADFMPTSQPPKPAPPVFNGVPYGQQGAAPQQPSGQPQQPAGQPQQSYAQPGYAAQQPYAQQPGQAAYYSQNNGYYAPGQSAYQVPYQQPLVHTKDHVAAGLLAIFLGVFGVHKFYLGYHTTGFIMLGVTILGSLLTIGIAAGVVWLIGVIEGIIYLTKSQSEFEQLYVFNKREMF